MARHLSVSACDRPGRSVKANRRRRGSNVRARRAAFQASSHSTPHICIMSNLARESCIAQVALRRLLVLMHRREVSLQTVRPSEHAAANTTRHGHGDTDSGSVREEDSVYLAFRALEIMCLTCIECTRMMRSPWPLADVDAREHSSGSTLRLPVRAAGQVCSCTSSLSLLPLLPVVVCVGCRIWGRSAMRRGQRAASCGWSASHRPQHTHQKEQHRKDDNTFRSVFADYDPDYRRYVLKMCFCSELLVGRARWDRLRHGKSPSIHYTTIARRSDLNMIDTLLAASAPFSSRCGETESVR